MKRNFKLGLILGIAILMLLPVYARAQIILNNLQGCIAPGTVANITASQGDTMSFVVTSRLPNLSMISDPDKGVTTFPNATNGTSTFTWPTGGSNPVAGGSYLAAFEANNGGTEAEYLVVMITIISTGGSPTSPTCTDFTYSAWSACQSNNTQTRTVTSRSPAGCVGGTTDPLSQSCTYTSPTCTSFTYSDWSACQSNNTQTRTVTSSSPTGCVGGTTLPLSQSCTYAPPTGNYPKLNQPAAGSGDFYGATISIAAGEVRTYILPLGEVYPNQNLKRLLVKSAALIDGTGQVSVKLTSPDTPPWINSGSSSTADFTLNAIAQSYPMGVNYPATYLNNGYWILQITGVQASQLKLWWKCY